MDQVARQIDLGAVDGKEPVAEPQVTGNVVGVSVEDFLVGALEDRFIKLASGGAERGRGNAALLRQRQLQGFTVIPEIIDRRAVALGVFRRDQAKDQQHKHHGVDDTLTLTPLRIIIGGHAADYMDHLLP